jgi:hypothetical protein
LSAASRTTMGRPKERSSMQHWQQFLRRAHVRQMFVRFCRAVRSAFQRKMVNGRVQILHSCAASVHASQMPAHKSLEPSSLQYHACHRLFAQPGPISTYRSMVFFQHLHIRVIRQAFFAHGRKVRGLPAAPVEVLLDLGWHIGGELSFLGAGTRDTKSL